jgi:hypothetical protein
MGPIASIKNNSATFFVTKYCVLSIVFSIAWCAQVSAKQTETLESKSQKFETIEWVDLIPQADLAALLNPPQIISEIPDGSPEDIFGDSLANAVEKAIGETQIALSPEDQAYYNALVSTNIKAEFNNKNIRIPGFIVPLEYSDEQLITEFFLVPYFGACIHVPPPPPNQIIYVKYPKGLLLDALYDPFWIEGQLNTNIIENELATSAYALAAVTIKAYEEFDQ